MNICFFSGVISTKPDFKFIISNKLNFKNSLHISISRYNLKIDNNTILFIKAYDELADYCFRNLKIGDYIAVVGRINGISEVEIDFCQVL